MAGPAKRAPAKGKAAPRTKGTPSKPPAPRKVAAPAKPKTAPARTAKPAAARRAKPKAQPSTGSATIPREPASKREAPAAPPTPAVAPPPAANPAVARAGWHPPRQPAQPADWILVDAPPAAATPVAPAFDPATGDWIEVADEPKPDPAAYRPGAVRSILLNVLLGIALALLAANAILGIIQGAVLVFAEDSAMAERIRQDAQDFAPSAGFVAFLMLTMFLLSGIIPFSWVLGTRMVPWEGTRKFLQLWGRGRDWWRGVALVPAMLVSVVLLAMAYVYLTEGADGFTQASGDEADEEGDPILRNLNWPLAILVALCAGIGEEILYRGVLQRWLGVWGQGILFGLAHAGNGFPPQVLFAFLLGVGFGYLFRRGWSLVSLIVAHTLYDFVVLSLALLFPDLA